MKAFLYNEPIKMLGGLIGAEFRLPVLTGLFGYSAKQAISCTLRSVCSPLSPPSRLGLR